MDLDSRLADSTRWLARIFFCYWLNKNLLTNPKKVRTIFFENRVTESFFYRIYQILTNLAAFGPAGNAENDTSRFKEEPLKHF